VYDLFDEVLVMAEGHVIFHGPRGQLEPHFGLLGFARQPGMTAADFVQNLTSEKDQQELWADGDKKVGRYFLLVLMG
jgi:ABC-type multidrug transport system ATPase subunit